MNLHDILKKFGLSEEYLSYFTGAFIMRPKYIEKDNVAIVTISCNAVLPFDVYREVSRVMAEVLGCEVELHVQTRKGDIEASNLIQYLSLLSDDSGKEECRNMIPYVADNKIYIPQEYNGCIQKIRALAEGIGTSFEVVEQQEKAVIKEIKPVVSAGSYSNAPESPFPRRRASRQQYEIDKSKYPFLPISKLKEGMDKISFAGQVFKVEYQTLRNKSEMQKIYITDLEDAIVVKRFQGRNMEASELHEVEEGQFYTVYGSVKYDTYDRFNEVDPVLMERMENNPFTRRDDYEGDRHCDLHVHTNKTEMDGVSECSELITQAFKFGQKAIAITDISVVQAYPDAQQAQLKIDKMEGGKDFKVIYGIEMKVADDTLNIVHNPCDKKLNDVEYMVFDLETTGLSTKYDHIIEFGGVIIKGNEIGQHYQTFVKPPVRIPPFIEQKTNITNEMLENAPKLEEVIDDILNFIGDRVIVAHNADFDFNFINEKLIEMGREPLKNTCLDTLNLAKEIVTNRKYYRLGLIARNYGVSYDDEEAHRGDYDAEVLAQILVRMLPTIKGYPDVTFNDLQYKQDADIYKKAHTYNVTLLAKNMAGIKAIYELVSLSHTDYLTYFAKENAKKADSDVVAEPRIIRKEIEKRRENILVGSANMYSELFEMALNRSDETLEECMKFYDYIEIQPLDCYSPLIEPGSSLTEARMADIVRNIIRIADKLGKPVIGNNDVYYTHPHQKIARDIYIMSKRIGGARHPLYPMNRERRLRFVAPDQHLMTTQEILDAFSYLDEDRIREIVIDNPLKIASQIEKLYPIPQELHTPSIDGCEQLLTDEIYKNAYALYGDPLPDIVRERIEKELNSVITNGFSVQYYIAYLLVKKSNEDGYIVGSRGSVGSSFIATMANITEVNPLVPHYLCPKCHYSQFFTNNEYANGFDLPLRNCPVCGEPLIRNGHSIPFETFLGFHGDKVPDIDLNFADDNQITAQLQIRDIFGENYAYRAGTIGTVAQKTAFGYIKGYCEEMEKQDRDGKPVFSQPFMEYLSHLCEGVKRTTGQHPGGIVVIPKENDVHDFTPVQYPANNPFADWKTTHFAFSDLHDNILKLDILGHVDPKVIRLLQIYTGIDAKQIPMNDPKALSLFSSTEELHINDPKGHYTGLNGAAGLPEFGTHNNRNILNTTKPTTFAELVALSGLTHGTDVWANNAEELIRNGTCTLKDVIACRDDIMTYLIAKGMDSKESFDIMEKVRKGRGLSSQWEQDMKEHDVPQWYIDSCNKIKYMFPKAHAVAYVMMAMRIAYCKVYHPREYYAVFFSCRCDAYDIETMLKGEDAIYERLMAIRDKQANDPRNVTVKESALESTLELALEMHLRGYHFSNISLSKSEAVNFIVDPDDDKAIVPSFASIDGVGENVGVSIVEARKEAAFISKEDLQKRTLVNNTQLAFLEKIGVLRDMGEENQLSLFNFL